MTSTMILDFSNVKETGNFRPKHMPEGDYRMKIESVIDDKSKDGNPMWVYTLALVSNPRATYGYYCLLNNEKQMWKIRNLFVAAGKTVPKKRVKVNPDMLVGVEIGVSLVDDEYEGKMKSTIDGVFPASELTESSSSVMDDEEIEGELAEDDEVEPTVDAATSTDDELELDDL